MDIELVDGHVHEPLVVSSAERAALEALVEHAVTAGSWPSAREWCQRHGEIDRSMLRSLQTRGLLQNLPRTEVPTRNGLRAIDSNEARGLLMAAKETHAALLRLDALDPGGRSLPIADAAVELGINVERLQQLAPLTCHGGGITVRAWEQATGRPMSLGCGDIVSQSAFDGMWSEVAEPGVIMNLADLQVWFDAGARQFHSLRFEHARARNLLLPGVELRNCVLMECELDNFAADDAHLIECRFELCDLVAAKLRRAAIRNTVFLECELAGTHLEGASFEGTTWTGSDVDGLRLSRGPVATRPRLADANFRGLFIGEKYVSRSSAQRRKRKKRAELRRSKGTKQTLQGGPMFSILANADGGMDLQLRGAPPVSHPTTNATKILQRLLQHPGERVHCLELCCLLDGHDWDAWSEVVDANSGIARLGEMGVVIRSVEPDQSARFVAVVRAIGARLAGRVPDELTPSDARALELIDFVNGTLCVTGILQGDEGPLKSAKGRIYAAFRSFLKKSARSTGLAAIRAHVSEAVETGEWLSYRVPESEGLTGQTSMPYSRSEPVGGTVGEKSEVARGGRPPS